MRPILDIGTTYLAANPSIDRGFKIRSAIPARIGVEDPCLLIGVQAVNDVLGPGGLDGLKGEVVLPAS